MKNSKYLVGIMMAGLMFVAILSSFNFAVISNENLSPPQDL